MDAIYVHHKDTQGIVHFNSIVNDNNAHEYSFVFTNEAPGVRVVTLGLHTNEKEKSYSMPEWDLDKDNVLIDRNVDEVKAEKEDKQDFDEIPHENHAANHDEIQNVGITIKRINKDIKLILHEAKVSLERQNEHNETVTNNTSWNFYVMLGETAIFLGIVSF